MDNPLISIANAAPSTTNNAAAVIISRICALEIIRKIGFISHLPAATKPNTAANATPMPAQLVEWAELLLSGERKATNAKRGTMERSSNNNVETTR